MSEFYAHAYLEVDALSTPVKTGALLMTHFVPTIAPGHCRYVSHPMRIYGCTDLSGVANRILLERVCLGAIRAVTIYFDF